MKEVGQGVPSLHLRLVSQRLSAMATRDDKVVAHAKELQDFMHSQEPVLSKQKYEVLRSAQACGVDWPGDPTQHYQLLLDMKRSLKQRVRNTEKPEPFIEAFSGDVSKIPASAYTDSPPGK